MYKVVLMLELFIPPLTRTTVRSLFQGREAVISARMSESEEASAAEWKEKYIALEALLLKFRGQMSVIRNLTAEKVSIPTIFLPPHYSSVFKKTFLI